MSFTTVTPQQDILETIHDIQSSSKDSTHSDGIWVFGYGSLIWKPPIHYEQKQIGYIKNYVRRFWQTIESVEGHDKVTWGVAFKIPSDDVEATRAYLDHREKALVYIGTTDNEAYVGPAPADKIAQQIHDSYGPSGWNAEYLLNLAAALREISPGVRDDHVFELEGLVKRIINDKTQ
ncbi:ChaC-like protein-domain-containing protein [Parasitella parasitica]|nr:ChaC-like protein-domain-containing protein [Parasitella parasitica]